jgi:hypothetical protein
VSPCIILHFLEREKVFLFSYQRSYRNVYLFMPARFFH